MATTIAKKKRKKKNQRSLCSLPDVAKLAAIFDRKSLSPKGSPSRWTDGEKDKWRGKTHLTGIRGGVSVDNSSATSLSRRIRRKEKEGYSRVLEGEGGSCYGLLIKIVQNGSDGKKKYITWNKLEKHWKFLLAIKVRDDVGNSKKHFPYFCDPGNLFVKRLENIVIMMIRKYQKRTRKFGRT
ncbi:hypothetical protein CEXT_532961 [Caerostris extrusa]|uniref:LAGLIDADG homing endonuclease n=1 Tax=Caerostris extrusa TaxID=172846 RepID=A0AAV4PNK2_CAEEX|nr:hypothetical protein CEXT_532961 [Caerostris extrusa]